MEWQLIVAMAVLIPVILFPAAFVWYLTASGVWQVMRESSRRRERLAKAGHVPQTTK